MYAGAALGVGHVVPAHQPSAVEDLMRGDVAVAVVMAAARIAAAGRVAKSNSPQYNR